MGRGLKLITKYLNHPILCLGYRFEYEGKSIVTSFDHEPFRNIFPTDPEDPSYNEEAAREGEAAANEENEKVLRFFKDADILIHDAQYTADEFQNHLGWGHSSYEYTIEAACHAGVKKLVFSHHDPNRTDEELKTLEEKYSNEVKSKPLTSIIMAREGLTIEA
jgi:phosphoribosyl 1,2-cyclic phosphodiesterase